MPREGTMINLENKGGLRQYKFIRNHTEKVGKCGHMIRRIPDFYDVL